jgi:hypothetical protein
MGHEGREEADQHVRAGRPHLGDYIDASATRRASSRAPSGDVMVRKRG